MIFLKKKLLFFVSILIVLNGCVGLPGINKIPNQKKPNEEISISEYSISDVKINIININSLSVNEIDILSFTGLVLKALPLIFTWAAFSFIFIAVPNCNVSRYYGIIGGLITSIFFELAKMVFGTVISYSSYTNIYGVFAIFPIFLMWVYLALIIILSGAEFVRSLETFRLT